MGDYFKGWRRKFSVLTLIMACVFMGGWVRSITTPDQIKVSAGKYDFHLLTSAGGQITWERAEEIPECIADWLPGSRQFLHPYGSGGPIIHARMLDYTDVQLLWRFKFGEFDLGQGLLPFNEPEWNFEVRLTECVLPYWAIVLTLTLISCWFLVSKPRKSNRNKITEPIPEMVA